MKDPTPASAHADSVRDPFQKKSKRGIAAPQMEIDLIKQRLKQATAISEGKERVRLLVYFRPSFFSAASKDIDSRMRLARVSGRLAV